MSEVTIYTSRICPYCMRALQLLKQKGATIHEISVDGDRDARNRMMAKSRRHTVPQIWIGEQHVGGCDDLMMLDRQGELDGLLAG
ncbi:MAG: glutaredoxin 3 [Candidatus Pelagadaptatus aseana]|uniref:glutaredoxin 3 n=1 Tax=Candidatus Pelagadaptatus aseana TaxID=3120508 RepID=UPI0039B14CB2